jgi:Glycosyl hydrolases family 2, TIM barrel domain/Glycosyl hydrolases family 2, sugar binding domain/Glycosyl hydrolases family 2
VSRPARPRARGTSGCPALLIGLAATVALAAGPGRAVAAPVSAATPPYPLTGSPVSAPTKGALVSDGPDGRYLLGGTWLYRADPRDAGTARGWWRGTASTAGWGAVTIPNAYNAGDFSAQSMAGSVGWYRRDFRLPRGAFSGYVPQRDRQWIVEFESVNYTATVWLNGHRLGGHAGAYLPFEFVLRGLRAGVNRLVVRVDDRRTGADLPPGPGGGWWNFGGLLDVVYLRPVERADLDGLALTTSLPCPTCAARIDARATVVNHTAQPQLVRLRGSYGGRRLSFGSTTVAPGASWTASAAADVAEPRLWAPGSPNLYHVTLRLTDADGRYLGGYSYLSGIRKIAVTAGGRLKLNGRLLDLRGVNLHEQSIATGAALSLAQQRQLIAWARRLGATVIRAHYPLDPELEQLADQDGILLWSEVPVYEVANRYLARASWRRRALAVLADDIEANQGHPAILLWSIGNELPTPATPAEAAYIAAAAAEVHELDPTRPPAMAVSDWPGVGCQAAYAPLRVIGINEYFGWFDAGGGTTDDRDDLGPFLNSVRACYPHQALIVSEFGFDGDREGPIEVRGTYAFQDDSIEYHLGVFATRPWLSGAIYFNLQDFASRPGYDGGNPVGTPPFVTNGLLGVDGTPKPAFSIVAALFHATSQIAPPVLPQLRR